MKFLALFVLFLTSMVSWSTEVTILSFGAVGDGKTMNTKAIQAAIDHCSDSGGGRVIIPAGTFLTGSILLKNNIELHFEQASTLLGSPSKEDYPLQPVPGYRALRDESGFRALVYAEGVVNIALTGNGTIDGQGSSHVREPAKADDRPKNLMLISCRKVKVVGLHFTSSAFWNQHYLNCEDVIVRSISVFNHSNYNNDAIDIDGCRRFVLSDCIFDTDDDGITLKSTGAAPTEDVVITNCIVSSFCNAIKAGTESTGGFRNIVISNCIVKPSASGKQPFFNTPLTGITGLSLMIVDGGSMEGITVNNLTINGTMAPLYIRLGNRARKYKRDVPVPSVGKIENISISNVVAYGSGTWGSSITGIPGYPVKNISLNNIQFFTAGGVKKGEYNENVDEAENKYPQPTVWGNLPASGLYIRHAKGITIRGLVFGTDSRDDRIPVIAEDVTDLLMTGCRLSGNYGQAPFFSGKDLKRYQIEKPLGWEGNEEYLQLITK